MQRPNDLVVRARNFAYGVYHLVRQTPLDGYNRQLVQQLIDSAFSGASNYRASQRGKSRKDFINKVKIALEEIDESYFWLNCLIDLNIAPKEKAISLIKESEELISILVTIINKTET